MAARNTKEVADRNIMVLDVADNAEIFEGTMVVINASGKAETASAAASKIIVGRAETYANETLEDGAKITVQRGAFIFENSTTNAVTNAHLLQPCYIENGVTVSSSSTNTSPAGIVLGVSDEGVVVDTTVYIPPVIETATPAE